MDGTMAKNGEETLGTDVVYPFPNMVPSIMSVVQVDPFVENPRERVSKLGHGDAFIADETRLRKFGILA